MEKTKIYFLILFLISISGYGYSINPSDNTLLKYYSALLTLNLNHTLDVSRIGYHLSKESEFNKELLEDILNKIEQNVDYSNSNIANISINVDEGKVKGIQKSIKNIDEHLAQALLDVKTIRNDLKNKGNVTPLLSDIYYQIRKAESEDHQEIRKILELKSGEKPLLVIPEIIK